MPSSSSMLDRIRIASPCDVDWDSMTGDDRKRYCGLCKLNVYNLSAMSRGEAEALVSNAEGRLCARFARRADGTVATQDCGPIRLRIRRRMRRLRAAAAAVLGLVSTFALSACGKSGEDTAKTPAPKETPKPAPDPEPDLMGIVCPPQPELMGDVAFDPEELGPREMGRVAPRLPKPPAPKPPAPKPEGQ